MPSCKFTFPANGATIAADETFTLRMAIRNRAPELFLSIIACDPDYPT